MKNSAKLIILVLAIVLIFSSCCLYIYSIIMYEHLTPGKYQWRELDVKNLENLKIIFGEQFLYPTTATKIENIKVESEWQDNLYDKRNKVEYMPELIKCSWRVTGIDYVIRCVISKWDFGNDTDNPVLGLQGECYRSDETLEMWGVKEITYFMQFQDFFYEFQIFFDIEVAWEEAEQYNQILYDYVAAMRIGGKPDGD